MLNNSHFHRYGDVMDADDISKLLNVSKRSARKIIQEQGGMKVAGKWVIGKVKIEAWFSK